MYRYIEYVAAMRNMDFLISGDLSDNLRMCCFGVEQHRQRSLQQPLSVSVSVVH